MGAMDGERQDAVAYSKGANYSISLASSTKMLTMSRATRSLKHSPSHFTTLAIFDPANLLSLRMIYSRASKKKHPMPTRKSSFTSAHLQQI
jgi:hypothetical protein